MDERERALQALETSLSAQKQRQDSAVRHSHPRHTMHPGLSFALTSRTHAVRRSPNSASSAPSWTASRPSSTRWPRSWPTRTPPLRPRSALAAAARLSSTLTVHAIAQDKELTSVIEEMTADLERKDK
jgi:hypothetical protein